MRNSLVDLVLKRFRGDADGIHDGAFAGRAVGFDDAAVKAEQRRAAVNFRVHPLFDGCGKRSWASNAPSLRIGLAVSSRFEAS